MRWLYVIFVALAYIASQASSQSSQVAGSGASKLSSETDDASDRSRRSLSDIAARRRSSLDKNFMRFGRSSSNFMRFGRSPSNFMRFGRSSNFMRFGRRGPGGAEGALEAMRALRCVDLLSALRGGRQTLDKRAAALAANADRRNDNFMRLGRAARDAADYEADGSSERRARDAQQRSEDEVKADDGAKYLGDGFLRLGRDPEDNTSSAEDVFEIDLPDERIY